jgi:hypothetical protein
VSIFVQIASYRDPELVPTIRDCIKNAKYPEKLTFGICFQKDDTESLQEFAHDKRFRVMEVPWEQSKGLCWARHHIQKMYAGEQYTLQLDSHHRFAEHWDEQLINMMHQTGCSKPIITSYAGMYRPSNNTKLNIEPYKMVADDFTNSGTILFRPHAIPEWQKLDKPIPARFVSGHFFFTLGQHCHEYKYDPNIYFAGDEISLSIRSFTLGYDLFHPHKTLIWHEYTREGRTKHWSDHDQKLKSEQKTELTWWERDNLSKMRLRHMLREEDNGIDLGEYGLGSVRTHHDYELYAGIDFKNRRLQQDTIMGVNPPNKFTDDSSWEAGFTKKYDLNLRWSLNDIEKSDDYQFWYFALADSREQIVFREDLNWENAKEELLLNKTNRQVNIRCDNKPKKLIIWPVSRSKGWLKKVEYAI